MTLRSNSDGNKRVTEQVCVVGGITLTGDIQSFQKKTNPSHNLSTTSSTLTGLTLDPNFHLRFCLFVCLLVLEEQFLYESVTPNNNNEKNFHREHIREKGYEKEGI